MDKAAVIEKLKQDLLILGGLKPLQQGVQPQGELAFMQAHFPQGVFPIGAVHEFVCPTLEQAAASTAFINGVISSCLPSKGVTVWVSTEEYFFSQAFAAFGVEPHHIIFMHPKQKTQVVWCVEEALRCPAVNSVVAQMPQLSFMQSRRFQLAVEATKVTGFILNSSAASSNTTGCLSKWQISPLPSYLQGGMPGVGPPRWQVHLQKMRHGKPGNWQVEWVNGSFRLVPQLHKQANWANGIKKAL
jgi:protein ImuA